MLGYYYDVNEKDTFYLFFSSTYLGQNPTKKKMRNYSALPSEKALTMLKFIESVTLGGMNMSNQENLGMILTFITPEIIQLFMNNRHITAEAASILLYNSRMYTTIRGGKTKLWHLSYPILHDMLEEELTKGKITFPEEQ
jgi:hypothetical protein